MGRFKTCPGCGDRVLADHLETDSGNCPVCEERPLWGEPDVEAPVAATDPAVTDDDYALAEKVVAAANIVSNDGYYELDIDSVARTLANERGRI